MVTGMATVGMGMVLMATADMERTQMETIEMTIMALHLVIVDMRRMRMVTMAKRKS